MNLNELKGEYLTMHELMSRADPGELDLFKDTMESIAFDTEEKLKGYGRVIENLNLTASGLKEKERKISMRRKSIESSITWLKEKMYGAMKLMGIKKIDDGDMVISVQKNGGKAPVIVKDEFREDLSLVPDEYKRTKVEIDMDAIRDALEAGVDLDFAIIGERGESLRIK